MVWFADFNCNHISYKVCISCGPICPHLINIPPHCSIVKYFQQMHLLVFNWILVPKSCSKKDKVSVGICTHTDITYQSHPQSRWEKNSVVDFLTNTSRSKRSVKTHTCIEQLCVVVLEMQKILTICKYIITN